MERVLRYTPAVLARLCLGLGVVAAVIGCHHACKSGNCGGEHNCCQNLYIDNCSDIPQGAIPQPVGTYVNMYLNREAGKAESDDFVIYYNEWNDEQPVLGPFGAEHIRRIASRLPYVPFPVIVQPEPDKQVLNSVRRQAVIDVLVAAGINDAANRVFLDRPAAEGLFGEEAERIYPQLIRGGFGGFGGGGGYGALGFGGGMGGFGGGFGGFGGGGGFGGFGGGFGFR
jgi:hypothetical protein